MSRCLYNENFEQFNKASDSSILGTLCDGYHGAALTTTKYPELFYALESIFDSKPEYQTERFFV